MAYPIYSERIWTWIPEGVVGAGVIPVFIPPPSFVIVIVDFTLTIVDFTEGDVLALEILSSGAATGEAIAQAPDFVTGFGIAHWTGRLVLNDNDTVQLSYAVSGTSIISSIGSGYRLTPP